jgi:hypothetical protein
VHLQIGGHAQQSHDRLSLGNVIDDVLIMQVVRNPQRFIIIVRFVRLVRFFRFVLYPVRFLLPGVLPDLLSGLLPVSRASFLCLTP